MLKKVLKLNGVQELNASKLKTVNGGRFPFRCTDSKGSFDSSIDVSGDGVVCTATSAEEDRFLYPSDGIRP